MPDLALEARKVSKVFVENGRATTLALQDVDLAVPRGTFLSLVGPSGCGKSTLLRILGGLEAPTSGEVLLAHDGLARRAVAFVFQDHGLFPWLSVIDNVAFGLQMAGVPREDRRRQARQWLARLGLESFERAFPEQLSGGMRQRASLARAFVMAPEVLLMDEPMAALDAQTRLLIQEDIIRLWEEARNTVVLVTHSLDEALLLGDRVVVLSARPGRVKLDIPVTLERPRTVETTTSVEFSKLKAGLWEALRDEVERALGYS